VLIGRNDLNDMCLDRERWTNRGKRRDRNRVKRQRAMLYTRTSLSMWKKFKSLLLTFPRC